MKSLVLITEDNHYEFDNLDALKEFVVPNFSNMKKEELEKYMYEKIFGFCMINDLQILETNKGVYEGDYQICNERVNLNRAIIIDNLDTYIVSLCKFNAIILLEEINNRYYTKDMEIKDETEKYLAVNKYADIILKKLVGDIK